MDSGDSSPGPHIRTSVFTYWAHQLNVSKEKDQSPPKKEDFLQNKDVLFKYSNTVMQIGFC